MNDTQQMLLLLVNFILKYFDGVAAVFVSLVVLDVLIIEYLFEFMFFRLE